MIKIECGDCGCDLNTGDAVFCEDCYKKLEDQVEKLGDENYKLMKTIGEMKDEKV